jgi:hypothetical protein
LTPALFSLWEVRKAEVLKELYLRVFAGDFKLNSNQIDSFVRRTASDNLRFVESKPMTSLCSRLKVTHRTGSTIALNATSFPLEGGHTAISPRGSLATLVYVSAHHAVDANTIHRNYASSVNQIATYYVRRFGHINEQARRLCLQDYCVEHSLGRLVCHALDPDVVCQVHVRQVKSRTPRTLSITQEEPPLSVLDVREGRVFVQGSRRA